MELIVLSFIASAICAIYCFRNGKYGFGFLAIFLLPAILIIVGVVFKMVYQIMLWGMSAQ